MARRRRGIAAAAKNVAHLAPTLIDDRACPIPPHCCSLARKDHQFLFWSAGSSKLEAMGIHVTDEHIDQWVAEAESGYDVDELQRRGRGRPGRQATASAASSTAVFRSA